MRFFPLKKTPTHIALHALTRRDHILDATPLPTHHLRSAEPMLKHQSTTTPHQSLIDHARVLSLVVLGTQRRLDDQLVEVQDSAVSFVVVEVAEECVAVVGCLVDLHAVLVPFDPL